MKQPLPVEILIDTFKLFPRNTPKEKPSTTTTLIDCQLVCNRFNKIIQRHSHILPRFCLNRVDITIDPPENNYKEGIFNWPGNLTCHCRRTPDLKTRSLALTGQLLFPQHYPNVPIHINIGGQVQLFVRNQLSLANATDLMHANAHLSEIYINWLGIRSYEIEGVTPNMAVLKCLNNLHAKRHYVSTVLDEQDNGSRQLFVPNFNSTFINPHELSCRVSLSWDNGDLMDELLYFLTHGQIMTVKRIIISVVWMNNTIRSTLIDTLLNYFTSSVNDFTSIVSPLMEIDFESGYCDWPSVIVKPSNLRAGHAYSCQMVNNGGGGKLQIELYPTRNGKVWRIKLQL